MYCNIVNENSAINIYIILNKKRKIEFQISNQYSTVFEGLVWNSLNTLYFYLQAFSLYLCRYL